MTNADLTLAQKRKYIASLSQNLQTPVSTQDFIYRTRGGIQKLSNEDIVQRRIDALRLGPLYR